MKKANKKIVAACLVSCLSVGSLSVVGAAFADNSKNPIQNATVASQEQQDKTQSKKSIQVAAGETFDITLEENTTTGYAWTHKASKGLELVNTKITDEDSSMIATPHQKTWTFKAEKAGTYTVDFTYGQSFNTKQAPEQKVSYSIEVGQDKKNEDTKKISVATGETFKIELEENPSTGYSWSFKTPKGLKLIKEDTKSSSDGETLGVTEQHIWTFKAEKAGTYTVDFTYGQSFDAKQATEQKVSYSIEVGQDKKNEDTKKISVATGETFKIELEENPSTGYSWSFKTPKGLKLIKEDTKSSSDGEMLGVTEQHIWTFKAEKAGSYTIDFAYSQPWEKIAPAEKASYTIEVSK